MTFRREDLDRGLEPDNCYYIQHEAAVRERDEIDLTIEPPPDLAVEVDITASSIDRLSIYMALGVPAALEAGANIIGSCCGSTPDHIRAMAKALRELPALSLDEVALASAPAQRQAPGAAQREREERRARRGA
jgi:hypothetical protein